MSSTENTFNFRLPVTFFFPRREFATHQTSPLVAVNPTQLAGRLAVTESSSCRHCRSSLTSAAAPRNQPHERALPGAPTTSDSSSPTVSLSPPPFAPLAPELRSADPPGPGEKFFLSLEELATLASIPLLSAPRLRGR